MLRLGFGNGGWIRVDDPQLPGPLFARLQPDQKDGRWVVTEVYIDGRGRPVTGGIFRRLDIATIEALANTEANTLRARAELPAVRLSEAASYYAYGVGNRPRRNWAIDMLLSQFPDNDIAQVERREDVGDPMYAHVPPLRAPEGGLTDDFLREVARAYSAALLRKERSPAQSLAQQAGVPVRTVHRWIYTARQRRIMERGRQGKKS
jgi:hypothetical protein